MQNLIDLRKSTPSMLLISSGRSGFGGRRERTEITGDILDFFSYPINKPVIA